jgi:threonine dehydratase
VQGGLRVTDPTLALPDLAAIRAARGRIAPHVHRTPAMTCRSLDAEAGARLVFKCENFQKIGAFKARGATNAVFALDAGRAARGVVTHSSGNHGAALAYAAARRGIPAWVVMPENAPKVKQDNVRRQGATIRFCAPTAAAREAECAKVQAETGAVLVHPFDNEDVIAGQGTAALELLEDAPDLDAVIAPVGGGGLLSGTAIAARGSKPGLRVFGAEPANADDAARSFASGRVEAVASATTIADGLRTPLSPRTLGAIRAHVAAIGLASEAAIVRAMRMTWERMKIVIEPSCAVPLACLLEGTLDVKGARVGVVLSGGNVDLDRLPWQP